MKETERLKLANDAKGSSLDPRQNRLLWPALYVGLMFASIPFTPVLVRSARSYLEDNFGPTVRTALLVVGGGLALALSRLPKHWTARRVVSLFVIVLVFGWQIANRIVPEDLIHLPQYGLLTFLFLRAIPPLPQSAIRTSQFTIFSVVFLSFTIGVLDEIYQGVLPNRVYDPNDILTNGVGVFLGFIFWYGGSIT